MKITKVSFHFLEGELPEDYRSLSTSKAKRRSVPANIYADYRQAYEHMRDGMPAKDADGKLRLVHAFLEIFTDENITGRIGPIKNPFVRERILRNYAPILIGMNPLDNEMIWDILYRTNMNGYAGTDMEAISACDNALWDIKAKAAAMPLNKLLGGASQTLLPAYCNCIGYSYAAEDVVKTVESVKKQGYKSMKWNVPAGPGDGEAGMREVEDLARLLRETAGPDFKIMLDCACSWDYEYTVRMLRRLEKFDLFWLEEPLMPQQIESYAKLVPGSPIRISLGEHLYTRWGFKPFLDSKAAHIYQPDPNWCGGLTETLKIMALITSHDLPVALHGSMPPVCTHLAAAYPITTILLSEFLDLVSRPNQHFYESTAVPEKGAFNLPEKPGIGIELNMNKASREWFQEKSCIS